MSNIIVGRTRARSQAIQLVFQAEVQGIDVFDLLQGGEYALDEGPIDKYADKLARGVAVNRLAIDRLISAVSHNWNLSRMPLVDRCVMAIAIYEMFCVEAVPSSVAISEAVELSKVYGTDDSSSFVNGILGRVSKLAVANPDVPLARLAQMAAEGVACENAPEAPAADGADAPAAAEDEALAVEETAVVDEVVETEAETEAEAEAASADAPNDKAADGDE